MEERRDIEHELAQSLKRLAVREPFEKITIKQITDGAGVIRVTFYNHFQDKYDLLAWIVKSELLQPVKILLTNGMYREAIVLIFNNILKEKNFYTHAVRIEGQNSFADIIHNCVYELLLEIFHTDPGTTVNSRFPWLTAEYLAQYYAQSICFVVLYWIRQGMTLDAGQMADIYAYIGTHSMWDVVEEMKKRGK